MAPQAKLNHTNDGFYLQEAEGIQLKKFLTSAYVRSLSVLTIMMYGPSYTQVNFWPLIASLKELWAVQSTEAFVSKKIPIYQRGFVKKESNWLIKRVTSGLFESPARYRSSTLIYSKGYINQFITRHMPYRRYFLWVKYVNNNNLGRIFFQERNQVCLPWNAS